MVLSFSAREIDPERTCSGSFSFAPKSSELARRPYGRHRQPRTPSLSSGHVNLVDGRKLVGICSNKAANQVGGHPVCRVETLINSHSTFYETLRADLVPPKLGHLDNVLDSDLSSVDYSACSVTTN